MRELNDYKQKIEQNNMENEQLNKKISKLSGENVSLGEEVRNAQENLRLSANAQAKLAKELEHYRSQIDRNNSDSETYRVKIQKLVSENSSLSEEVSIAQENLRLSANTVSKLNNELKVTCNENEELKRRVDELARMVDHKTR